MRIHVRSLVALSCVAATACGGAAIGADEDAGARGDAGVEGDVADSGEPDASVELDSGRDAGSDAHVDTGIDAGPPPLEAPYPIVLAHGFFGFEELGGVDFATYFFGVKEDLAARGEMQVFTPAVDPFQLSSVRGERLIEHIEAILLETGHDRVNLIGHSQGGLDVRYVASMRPDLVASVVTISTPHRGTPIIDTLNRFTDNALFRDFVDELVRLIGAPLWDESGAETSVFRSLEQLSEEGAAEFNARYPDVPGIPYWSIAGRSGLHFARSDCAPDVEAPDFITDWDRTVDPVDPLLAPSEALFDGGFGDPFPNDGLVRISSARWGTMLGCIPADHLDEIGHLFGDGPGLGNRWDHRAFYADLVEWLRDRGL